MKRTILVAIITVSAILIQSCDSSEESITTNARASFEMRAVQSSTTSTQGRVAATGYTFTEVMAGVTEIELETLEEQNEEAANGGEAEDEEIEFEGNFIINLLTGTSDPDFGISELLPGVYEEIEIEFDDILEGNKSLIAKFYSVAEGTSDTTFVEFSTEEEFEFEIENEDQGFVLDASTLNTLLVTLDLDVIFGSVNLNGLDAGSNGVIYINEDTNSGVMDDIVEKLEESLDGYDDYEDYDDED